jgi:hypothetical protein
MRLAFGEFANVRTNTNPSTITYHRGIAAGDPSARQLVATPV